MWVDPKRADVFLAGYTTNPGGLKAFLQNSLTVTQAAFIEFYQEGQTLGEPDFARMLWQVGLDGSTVAVTGIAALSGVTD